MPKPWAENPKTFNLTRRDSGAPFSFRDPDGDGIDNPAASLIFSESFDDQLDWDSGQIDTGALGSPDTLQFADEVGADEFPGGWYSASQFPRWSPSNGYPSGHEAIEIQGADATKVRGGSGKSLVCWRDSFTGESGNFSSDSQLSYYIPGGYEQIFVRFYIKFDPNWTPLGDSGLTKLFRIAAWDETTNTRDSIYDGFNDGNQDALLIWDYEHAENTGVRNKLAFRGDPQETNYRLSDPAPINLPRTLSNGSISLNFVKNIRDLDGGGVDDNTVDSLFSLVTGNPIGSDQDPTPQHADLWGDVWHKVEFYLAMNSGPGNMDGVVKQWIDGQLVFANTEFPWMGNDSPGGIKWTVVTFGGNSDFHAYPDEDQRQEWRAYDDIEIMDGLPEDKR